MIEILVLLGMYFDAVVVFVTSQTLLFRLASVHENKKPHECPICDSKFSEKGDLKRHIETVHENKLLSFSHPIDGFFPMRDFLGNMIIDRLCAGWLT